MSKVYVDFENVKQDIAIADKANKDGVFIRDNSGNLDMGGKEIINLKPFVEDDDKDQTGHVVDFSYFHTQRGELKRIINEASSENVPKYGSESMIGNLDMNNHS